MAVDSSSSGWFNRTVIGAGLTSLLSDIAYEMATSVLAGFFVILQIPQWMLGLVEGTGDALANFVKLGVGYHSDRIGRRKVFVVGGYALTGVSLSLFAFAMGWPLILLGKALAWIGKGLRGPLRDAILADAVDPRFLGRAFGFHRAGDTIGAILGPLLGAVLLATIPVTILDLPAAPHRIGFLCTLVPGLGAAAVFLILVREQRFTPRPGVRFREALSEMPRPYRRYLLAVGLFGMGDFSHSLLILASTILLVPSIGMESAIVLGPILYATRNAWAALTAFPVGAMSDRFGRRGLLALGYAIGVLVMLGFAAAFHLQLATLSYVAALFVLAGVYIAIQESLEAAMTADMVPDRTARGTAYGLLGCVNGVGDLAASVMVGVLFVWRPELAFVYASGWMLLGCLALGWVGRLPTSDMPVRG